MYKLSSPDWAAFTGQLGGANFEEGVTHNELTVRQIMTIGGNVSLERVNEDGTSFHVGPTVSSPEWVELLQTLDQVSVAQQVATESTLTDANAISEKPFTGKYTVEQLEQIADKSGIAGLREIASQHGVKGRSIAELINGLTGVEA